MEKVILSRLTALGHPKRMALFRLLMRRYPQAVPAGELAEALELKASTLSVYLSALAGVGLIEKRRHATSLHYQVRLEAAREIIDYLFLDCCRGRPQLCPSLGAGQGAGLGGEPVEGARKQNVIFICTGNSARSILAEVILRDAAPERFNSFSAGTRPAGAPHPLALEVLGEKGHDIRGLRSKSLGEFQGEGAVVMDYIFTVCDSAANEECPLWPGQPISGHWGIPDPAAVTGSQGERKRAFIDAYQQMQARIDAFLAIEGPGADKAILQRHIDEIGALAPNQ